MELERKVGKCAIWAAGVKGEWREGKNYLLVISGPAEGASGLKFSRCVSFDATHSILTHAKFVLTSLT